MARLVITEVDEKEPLLLKALDDGELFVTSREHLGRCTAPIFMKSDEVAGAGTFFTIRMSDGCLHRMDETKEVWPIEARLQLLK